MSNPQSQDEILTQYQDQKTPVHVFLISGIKLVGVINAHDDHAVCLENPSSFQLVYKHAISTVAPQV